MSAGGATAEYYETRAAFPASARGRNGHSRLAQGSLDSVKALIGPPEFAVSHFLSGQLTAVMDDDWRHGIRLGYD